MLAGWPLFGLFEDNSASCGSGWHASDATTALAAAVLAAVTVLLLKREWFNQLPTPCSTYSTKRRMGTCFHTGTSPFKADQAQPLQQHSHCCRFSGGRPPLLLVVYHFKQHLPFAGLLTALFVSTGTAWWVAVLAALVLLAVAALWTGTRARDADVLATFLVVRALGGRHAVLFTLPGGRSASQRTALTSAARQRAARVKVLLLVCRRF